MCIVMVFVTQSAIAQEFRCGTPPPTDRVKSAMIEKIQSWNSTRSSLDCSDAIDFSPKTYKLILEYVDSPFASIGFPTSKMPELHAYIDSIFNPVGIYFEYYDLPLSPDECNNCQYPNGDDWPRIIPVLNNTDFLDCLWGRISASGIAGIGGQADINYGRFWAVPNYTTIVHELGHALGLLHTFDSFSSSNFSRNEHVYQNNDEECPCNCKVTGDLICDTQVDPFDVHNEIWNISMFGDHSDIFNSDDEVDHCGISYSELDANLVIGNVMSYHHHNKSNYYRGFTIGQASYMKKNNEGKPWEVTGTPGGGGSMQPGFVVNEPMEITSPMDITGNIEVHSKLTIKNTWISFVEQGTIIIHPKGELILDNAHLKPFSGMGCFPETEAWEGIRIPQSGTSRLTLKNGSTINGARTAVYSRNATLLAMIKGGSRINSFFTQAIDVEGGKGTFEVQGGSIINGSVTFKRFYSGINLNRSIINVASHGVLIDRTKRILIEESGFIAKNGCIVNGNVEIDNLFGSQTVSLHSSTFNETVFIRNSQNRIVVRDNKFNSSNTGLIVFQCVNYDIYNNEFTNSVGLDMAGWTSVAPLIFKNEFRNHNLSLKNTHSNSKARLECNNMLVTGNRDWRLDEPIERMQGNKNLAAGNSFSRSTGLEIYEVYYDCPEPIYYFYKDQGTEEPIYINSGSQFKPIKISDINAATTCNFTYPNTPVYPEHCNNGIKDGDETGVDCGGSCKKCIIIEVEPDPFVILSHCSNGVLDGDETGIDCGGSCPPCLSTCSDGIQNYGEHGIDCGGPCPPCYMIPTTCTDGIMNGNETGVDCGGPTCPPCPVPDPPLHCNDGILSGDETDVDCGGSCPDCLTPVMPAHCYNGVKDEDETGIDCGGSCDPCDVINPPHCFNGKMDGNETDVDCGGSCKPCIVTPGPGIGVYTLGDHEGFITDLNEIYGEGYFTTDRYHVVNDFEEHWETLDNGNSCLVQDYIDTNSDTNPSSVISLLAGISPNVSANAIHRLFANSVHYTSGQISDILKANPAVLSDNYIGYIVYRTNTFSPIEKEGILSAVVLSDTRAEYEVLLSYKQQYQNAIIRDNIAMLSQNTPKDFNAIRAELATDPDPNKVFEIAQLYVEQGRHDLAATTLENADVCRITDPYFRAQLNALTEIYAGWNDFNNINKSSRNIQVYRLSEMLSTEHGMATDIAAKLLREPIRLVERRKYEPLQFVSVTNVSEVLLPAVEIYPNPATDLLFIQISGIDQAVGYKAVVTGADGKFVSEFEISDQSATVDISTYVPGIYTVQVKQQGKMIYVTKLVKI